MDPNIEKPQGSPVPKTPSPPPESAKPHRADLSDLVIPSTDHKAPSTTDSRKAAASMEAMIARTPEQVVDRSATEHPTAKQPATILGAINKLGTAIGSTLCFSLTGVFNQGARGEATEVSQYPNPFLYCTLRSTVASVATYLKDRASFQETGIVNAFREIGPQGRLMCGLMAANNLLWIPAFMLTDLASALVIGGAQPFVHSIYESVRARKLPSALKMTGLALTGCALSTVILNQATSAADYPHAHWGNLAAFAASICFVSYMTINNRFVESARTRAVPEKEVEAAKQIPSETERSQKEHEHETIRTHAQKLAQTQLRAVPFFSQVASAVAGLAFFVPQFSNGFFSTGLGLNPLNTLVMGSLHGICTAAGLYLRTQATQTNKPSIVSLVSGVQIGLTPLFGYLLFQSPVPQFAILAGTLAFCSSLTGVAEVHLNEKKKQQALKA